MYKRQKEYRSFILYGRVMNCPSVARLLHGASNTERRYALFMKYKIYIADDEKLIRESIAPVSYTHLAFSPLSREPPGVARFSLISRICALVINWHI